ncbi:MAG: hypothetical protein IT289_08100 [Oligoflexia bacterium]|nr:hypothetical protein [Oligoflexia bacterium]
MKSKIIWIFPSILFVVFVLLSIKELTLTPVDLFLTSPELYKPGAAQKVNNTFVTDVADVLVPWKFYLSANQNISCDGVIHSRLGTFAFEGVKLPQGLCYPWEWTRPYSRWDSFWLTSRFVGFFDALNWSQFFLLTFFYFSSVFFFSHLLPASAESRLAVLGAVLLTTSQAVTRDLQYDVFVASMGFMMLAVGCLFRSDAGKKSNWLFLSWGLLTAAFAKTSIQGVVIVTLMVLALLIIQKGWPYVVEVLKRSPFPIALVLVFLFFYFKGSGIIFLSYPSEFLPSGSQNFLVLEAKKTLAFGQSILTAIWGPILWSFDSLDPFKLYGGFGGREYPSYDNIVVILGPVGAALGLLLINLRAIRFGTKWRIILAISLVLILTPAYRYLYFRFHQWWISMMIVALVLESLVSESHSESERPIKRVGFLAALVMVVPLILAFFGNLYEPQLRHALVGKGIFGFETGYWDQRLATAMARWKLANFWSWLWIGSMVLTWYLHKAKKLNGLVVLATLSGLGASTFYYNRPQSRVPFELYRTAEIRTPTLGADLNGRRFPPNIGLLRNQPVAGIYDSLTVSFGDLTQSF